jgi:nucleoside-diphosphate-sugar epimerase
MSRDRAHIDDIIEGTYGIARNVLRAAEISGVKKFVQFGTIEEYGSNEAPFVETMRESPISAYSLGKTMATHEALLLSKISDMKVCVVRPAATFGPGKRVGMLVPNFIRAALSGTDFNMNAGEQERDFIFVDDVAEASLRAALSDRTDGEIINVGSGIGMTVRGFVESLNEAMGNPIAVHFGAEPYRINDTMRFFMNIDKAKRLLSWEPEVALSEALRITVEWYRANADIFGAS